MEDNEITEVAVVEESNTMDVLERLRAVVEAGTAGLTDESKAFVKELADANGVTIRRSNCKSCYIDAAIEVYRKLTMPQVEVQAEPETHNYILKDGVDLLFNGWRINKTTCTDKAAKRWIAAGFPVKYFAQTESTEVSDESQDNSQSE